jgi:predicted MFS family arabinose efflux permease
MGHDERVSIGAPAVGRRSREVLNPGLRRFTRAHATAAAADAFVTVSLAGSLFFSVSPDASRRQVLTYLIVTMAPFAVLAPLIGPAIDRFRRGHRWIAVLLYVARAVLSLALAFALFSLFFYFLALALLVANKASGVLKSALMPGLVDDPSHLIDANSRLARVTTVVGGTGGAVAAAIAGLFGSSAPLFGAAVLFTAAAGIALRLPRPRHAGERDHLEHAHELEYDEVHRPLITISAAAYTVIRAAVGAFVFGLAFALRRASEPAWMYGAALVAYGIGAYAGNVVAPLARRRFSEDRLIAGALIGLAVLAGFGAAGATRIMVISVAAVMGLATTLGRQGFDSLVQRQAPLALHGRSFARFETQFQLGWVIGAAFATAAAVPTRISLAVFAAVLVPSAALYLRAAAEARRYGSPPLHDDLDAAVYGRLAAAEQWIETGHVRFAAVDMAAAADLLLAAGTRLPAELVAELRQLRTDAIDPSGQVSRDTVIEQVSRLRSAITR